ncbi:hypothetical protein F5888DRAFT_652217 [Russula emetica]|nr:hypothetical protein F5888DRAFT_652217 [Russula emetica]
MSHANPSTSSSPNFQLIFNNALKAYEKRTKSDLLAHPLVPQLQDCNSLSAFLAVTHQQVQEFHQSRGADERLTRWLDPTMKVLYSLSETLGEGVSLVFSPAKVIFAGVEVLLSAAMDVRASQDTLIDIFERMENFFQRLGIYTNLSPTPEMIDMIVKIMVEVLSILAIATKEMKQSRTRKYLKKLIGRTDLEDALKRLEKLTNEEVRMATAQVLKATHTVDDRVRVVENRVLDVDNKVTDVDDRVAGVDDRVARVDERVIGVDERVAGVDERVAGVDDYVKAIDDKVAVVVDDGKETRIVIQQVADDMDQVKRPSQMALSARSVY